MSIESLIINTTNNSSSKLIKGFKADSEIDHDYISKSTLFSLIETLENNIHETRRLLSTVNTNKVPKEIVAEIVSKLKVPVEIVELANDGKYEISDTIELFKLIAPSVEFDSSNRCHDCNEYIENWSSKQLDLLTDYLRDETSVSSEELI